MKAEEQRAAYTAARSTVSAEWPVVPFEKVATPQSDRGKRIKQRDYLPEGRIPVIDQGQAPIGGYTDDEDFAFSGDLPVVLFGDHTRAVKLVSHRFAVGADGIKIFRPSEGVRPKYLYYWMKSAPIPDRGYGRHYQYLRQLSVPMPPPSKQDEIVAEIEKQFSRLDEAVANLKRVKANLKRYKAAVLKTAVEGRLVETEAERARREGRSYETGAQLLQRILETRRSQWQGKGKYKEPAAPDTTDLPELPEGWAWLALNQFAFLENGDRSKNYPSRAEFVDEGVPFINAGHLEDGRIDMAEMNFISEERFALLRAGKVREDDLLFCLRGSLGKVAIVSGVDSGAIASSLVIVRPTADVIPGYLLCYFMSPLTHDQIQLYDNGSAQPNLSAADLGKFVVPIPPVATQRQIVAEVDRRFSIVRENEAQAEVNLQRAEGLRRSLLAKAFMPSKSRSLSGSQV